MRRCSGRGPGHSALAATTPSPAAAAQRVHTQLGPRRRRRLSRRSRPRRDRLRVSHPAPGDRSGQRGRQRRDGRERQRAFEHRSGDRRLGGRRHHRRCGLRRDLRWSGGRPARRRWRRQPVHHGPDGQRRRPRRRWLGRGRNILRPAHSADHGDAGRRRRQRRRDRRARRTAGHREDHRRLGRRHHPPPRDYAVRYEFYGLDGIDRLDGANGPDTLDGGRGRDTLAAFGGSDTIFARDGETDTVGCGSEIDTAHLDADDIDGGCENLPVGVLRFAPQTVEAKPANPLRCA